MPAVTCPTCLKPIPAADVNVEEGVAFCRACGELTRLSELAYDNTPPAADVLGALPPAGCRIEDDGVTLRVIASARSVGAVIGLTFFALFWNALVGVFLAVVGSSVWVRLVGPLPSWFPTPFGSASGSPMPLAIALFMMVFLTPFVLVGVFLLTRLLLAMFGRVVVSVRGEEGSIFTGVGAIGRRRKFNALAVKSVRVIEKRGEDSHTTYIGLETTEQLSFGSELTEQRRRWMTGVLREILVSRPSRPGVHGHRPTLPRREIPPVAGPPLHEELS